MPEAIVLITLIVICALAFDYINGFHDTANAIATVVSTRVMTPRAAIIMAASLNFIGALISTNVAKTVASGLVGTSRFAMAEIKNPGAMADRLQAPADPVSLYLSSRLSTATRNILSQRPIGTPPSERLKSALLTDLNTELTDKDFYSKDRFKGILLTKDTTKILKEKEIKDQPALNRALLEAAYPKVLGKSDAITQVVILAAIIAAIIWNLITWKFGIPSSSSHALIGGLVGAALVHGGPSLIIWQGNIDKVLIPLIASPLAGFIIGYLIMLSIFLLFSHVHPGKVSSTFRHLQLLSAACMAFTHGMNDAQKSMGIITMSLVSIGFLKHPLVPIWVILLCATAMALGTSAGGWRIIKTMGHRIIRLEPVHGFAAETSAAAVIFISSHFGMPVSTTHVIAGSIFGVGSSKRLSAVRWGVAGNMMVAWILTIPASASVAGLIYLLLRTCGLS